MNRPATWTGPVSDFDVCHCGDYRHFHMNGRGACGLGSRCSPPPPCKRFKLSQRATEIPEPYRGPYLDELLP